MLSPLPLLLHFFTLLSLLPSTLSSPPTPIQTWSIISSLNTSTNTTYLSQPNLSTSQWLKTGSKGTVVAVLLENKVFNEEELFYSENLKNVDGKMFGVPWWYRSEFTIDLSSPNTSSPKSHTDLNFYTLSTHGITSRATIYLNAHLIANHITQAGSYAGLDFDISEAVKPGVNVLLVKVWPSKYDRDFALGFVDWNPSPPDGGMGVWRDVEVKMSGAITLSDPRVVTALDGGVKVYVEVKNLGKNTEAGHVECAFNDPKGRKISTTKKDFELSPKQQIKVELKTQIADPQIWWPRQWGSQPLYSVQCNATSPNNNLISDSTPPTKFGIRTVTSTLNTTTNTTTFTINNTPFQVLGAGYTSDIFLRFTPQKLRSQLEYVLDMGLNTLRLEGKQEHPALYSLADELGLMVLPGWECCDKWEGWTYEDGGGEKWDDADYAIANNSMRHEAKMMQSHPSILGFLVGSDYWPDERATGIYVDALRSYDWATPIIASASQRGAPDLLGNGGMKMAGPYDWVPPNYWFDREQRLGSAGGFGSELGAGVGTPELGSLRKFLSEEDMDDLWKRPEKGLYHMSTNVSSFYTRAIYNTALTQRFGAPSSLHDYLLKAQITDYEATRAQFEAYLSRWSPDFARPATGLIYWMLNSAWPSLHWNLFDYYLHPGGAYFGAKKALGRMQHVLYDYQDGGVFVVDRRREMGEGRERRVDVEVLDLEGNVVARKTVETDMRLNSAKKVTSIPAFNATDVVLLRISLKHHNTLLSSNTYFLAPTLDTLDWENSTWYHTPVTKYSNFHSLFNMARADVHVHVRGQKVVLENKSRIPAVFVRLNLVDEKGKDVVPVFWEDNYVTLWPDEVMETGVEYEGGKGVKVVIDGVNVRTMTVEMGGY